MALGKFVTVSTLAAAALAGVAGAHAAPLTMNVRYFTVTPPDPDYDQNYAPNGAYNWGTWNDLVTGALGPDGLPVYNTHAAAGEPDYVDLNAHGELTWWSPAANSHVQATGSGTVTLPFSNGAFYPPNGAGGGDGAGFQSAIFTATLVVPQKESVTFTFGADDDAFLYLDGHTISQEEGIHGVTAAPVTTAMLDPGSYSLELFYTDRHQTGAGLYFSVDTADVTVAPPSPPSAVPEPAALGLMLAGLGILGGAARRRARR